MSNKQIIKLRLERSIVHALLGSLGYLLIKYAYNFMIWIIVLLFSGFFDILFECEYRDYHEMTNYTHSY